MSETGQKVYIGNCEGVPENDLRDEFAKFGPLENVWIARNPPGFAFVWYRDDRDAQDAVSSMDGKELCGQVLRVEMSRNRGRRDDGGGHGGGGYGSRAPPRKTGYKVRISGLPSGTHWTELKDFVRRAGEVIYANVEGDEGVAEFPDRDTMNRAAKDLDDAEFGDKRIRVDIQDESDHHPSSRDGGGGGDHGDGGGYNSRRNDNRGRDDFHDSRRRDDRRRDYGHDNRDYDRRDDRGYNNNYDDRGYDRGRSDRRGRSRSPRGRY